MKKFKKVHSKFRKNQEERGQYAVMKKNQRKAHRRQDHVEDAKTTSGYDLDSDYCDQCGRKNGCDCNQKWYPDDDDIVHV